jgi:methylmalonyl-CoA mutase
MDFSEVADFPKSDKNKWRKQLEKELKGRPYEDIFNQIDDKVCMEPYYVEDDLNTYPKYREVQNCQKKIPGWITVPYVDFQEPKTTNGLIRQHLERGADAVWVHCGTTSLDHLDIIKLLYALRLTDTPLFLDTNISPKELLGEMLQGAGYYLKGGVVYDPLSAWMRQGHPYEASMDAIAEGMSLTKAMREFRSYTVGSHAFHEAGAGMVQELAFTLSAFVTYLDHLTDRGVSPLLAATRAVFSFSIGTDYLAEIARLRAFRYLYRRIIRSYALPEELCQPFVHAQTSRLFLSGQSAHTNMIRHSSEAMSSVMGGCDALTVLPYDAAYADSSEFSDRIARNTSLLLKHESYLDKVADPAAGSYYLEILTLKLAEASWEMFMSFEEKGGLISAFEQNFIQEDIKTTWNNRLQDYQNGKIMVGVNKYQVEGDAASAHTRKAYQNNKNPSWEYSLLPSYFLSDHL